jgi:hypothetical protein
MGRGLSEQQKTLLRLVGSIMLAGPGGDRCHVLDQTGGVRLTIGGSNGARRAAASRSLRRLCERGLLAKREGPVGLFVQLTPAGWATFEGLRVV